MGDGIAESIIDTLAEDDAVRVVNRPRAFRYRGANVDPAAAGRELGVDAVLIGRVAQHAGNVVVKIDMIEVATGDGIWGAHYTRPMTDVFHIQEDVAADVISKLRGRLASARRSRLRPPSDRGDAYRHYLKGRFYWNKRTVQGFQRAVEEFTRAIDIDPEYAPAHAGLADAYVLLGTDAWGTGDAQSAFPAARAAALAALALDDGLADAHTSLAMTRMYFDHDWAASERSYRDALAFDPDYITAHMYYAMLLSALGRLDEALRSIRRAHELDPLSPVTGSCLGLIRCFRAEYAESLDAFHAVLAREPDFHVAHQHLCATYEKLGDLDHAMAHAQKGAAINNHPNSVAVLGWLHGLAGRSAEAHANLEQLQALAAQGVRVSAYNIALIWLGLRDFDRTFAALNRAIDERSTLMTFAGVLPWFDPLRADPRFDALLGRLGLAKAAPRLVIRCFGSFTVSRAGVPIEFPTRRSRALLAYLAASGDQWHTRESLAALLWPDSAAEAARRSLRQELSTLRPLIGDATLEVEADRVRLAPSQYSCDLQAVESARPIGDFLEDISALADPFDEWVADRRRQYRDDAQATLESLLTRAERDGRSANVIRLAQQILAIEPANEAVHRNLMQAYVTTNQPTLALQQFRRCLTVLRRELQVTPSAETRALYDRIRAAQRTSRVRILVVDDNPVTRTQIEALLADRFDVRLAEHGANALLDLGADEIDLVIADVDMPVLDGLKLLEVLRQRLGQLPVLIITGMEGKDVERRARGLGASGFLRKPIDARPLLAAIRRVLAEQRVSKRRS